MIGTFDRIACPMPTRSGNRSYMWFDRSLQFVSSHSKERCKLDWAHRAAHPEVNFHLDINGSAADQQRGLAGIGCSDGPDPDAMAI